MKVWFSSACTNMGRQTRTTWNLQQGIAFRDMLGGGDDLGSGLLFLITLALLPKEVCFSTLELLDLLGQGCVSLGEHIDGVHTFLQILTDVFLLKREQGKLATDSFQSSGDGINLRLPEPDVEWAKRALLAWSSIPGSKKATPKKEWQYRTVTRIHPLGYSAPGR